MGGNYRGLVDTRVCNRGGDPLLLGPTESDECPLWCVLLYLWTPS